jgi:hypothetical protein
MTPTVLGLGALLLQGMIFAGVHQTGAAEKLTIVNGYAFVDVSINGRGPFRMMIDTGASSCWLTPEVAFAAGLTFDHRVVFTTMAGERLVPAASNARVRLGSEEAGSVEVLSLELDGVRTVSRGVDGVLGQSFLGRFVYMIDYRRKLFRLGDEAGEQVPSFTTEILAEQAQGTMVLPVGIEPGAGIWRLTLDTGSDALVMRCGAHCPQVRDSREGDRIMTNSGSRGVRRGFVDRITVGAVSIPRAEVALLDGPVSGFADGVLPANWFAAVYVDSARNLVRLAKW